MGIRVTHTYVVMEISAAAYAEIKAAMLAADYGDDVFGPDGEIDMHGIAVAAVAATEASHDDN
jgi:hypothetical protein